MPKQFLRFVGEGTLFQQTFQRLRRLAPADHIYTITRRSYRSLVTEQVADFVPANIIVEPRQRNTAPCIALGLAYVLHREAEAAVAILPSDHHIADEQRFVDALQTALAFAAENPDVVTFGIRPDHPHTGFGYIEVGEIVRNLRSFDIHRGTTFIEKPDLETAKRLAASGSHLWNSGIFVARAEVLFELIRQNQPAIHAKIEAIRSEIGSPREAEALEAAFQNMPSESIDKGVMERIREIAVIPLDVGWNDLGSWASLRRLHLLQGSDNLVLGQHLLAGVSGATVAGSNRTVVIGLDDVIVASRDGYVLVCAKDQEHRIQELVDRLENEAPPRQE
jgi:mannose-1-phosphate guanylyltransferase